MSQSKSIVVRGVTKMEGEFSKVLPGHIPSDRFVRNAITLINSNPELRDGMVNQSSIYSSLMKAAQDGLVVDGREAAVITFGTKNGKMAQYIPMVPGLIKKMRNTGEIASITHGIVYRNEYEQGRFEYVKGDNESLRHEPILFEEKGDMIGVYAVVTLKDGTKIREFMDMDQINKVRKSSPSGNSKYSPWNTWFEQMCIKSVLRRVSKLCPMSSDLDRVFMRDEEHPEREEIGVDVDGITVEEDEASTKKETAALSAVKKKSTKKKEPNSKADNEAEDVIDVTQEEDVIEAVPIEEDLPL